MRLITVLIFLLVFSSCGIDEKKAGQKEESIKLEYLQKGEEIAGLTQSELLKNVSLAMKEGGTSYAIEFCHLNALELKDSLSQLFNCQIERKAIKYRNPVDKPHSGTEKNQLNKYQSAARNGESLNPIVFLFEDRIEYYQPILINNGACLICHGLPGEQISNETFEMIKERYPGDLATGFAMNDFRGAWKITFRN